MAVTEEFLASKILQLVAVMSESLFVGSYFILIVLVCCILVYALGNHLGHLCRYITDASCRSTKYGKISTMLRTLFGASVAMFIISAVHLGLVVQELGAKESLPENGQAQIIISMFQFLIGELILLWRLWVVWERSYWIVVIPIVLIISATGLTLNLLSSHDVFFAVPPVALIVTNAALCTSLIAGKIWYVGWKVRSIVEVAVKKKNSWWRGAAALIIEPGVLYTAIQILSLILHYRKSVALPILLDLQVPVIGVLPTLSLC
ncbi:hypothetical protein FPV67DRAFT_628451 [Lyophyllum atratum]|nr:hypothetical protein FPV67DRAFT_628451 [Lyophyllum atratum]